MTVEDALVAIERDMGQRPKLVEAHEMPGDVLVVMTEFVMRADDVATTTRRLNVFVGDVERTGTTVSRERRRAGEDNDDTLAPGNAAAGSESGLDSVALATFVRDAGAAFDGRAVGREAHVTESVGLALATLLRSGGERITSPDDLALAAARCADRLAATAGQAGEPA